MTLRQELESRVIGQPDAMKKVAEGVTVHKVGLAPEGRPAGVFLFLGPTGTGKTRTVEALAEVLHGSDKIMMRIDCAEYQMEHEVAKLIGAPPGYLGHRETATVISQNKLTAVTSEQCNLSLVLFDEIDKAAHSLTRLLLGVLDKAVLKLGDNTVVNFERCLIFMTSNTGAEDIQKELGVKLGFLKEIGDPEAAAKKALKRRFSPEFLNRVDHTITFKPLTREHFEVILDQQLSLLQRLIIDRRGDKAFAFTVSDEARQLLLDEGTSTEYGARELKRVIYRKLTVPLSELIDEEKVPPRSELAVTREGSDLKMTVEVAPLDVLLRASLSGLRRKQ